MKKIATTIVTRHSSLVTILVAGACILTAGVPAAAQFRPPEMSSLKVTVPKHCAAWASTRD